MPELPTQIQKVGTIDESATSLSMSEPESDSPASESLVQSVQVPTDKVQSPMSAGNQCVDLALLVASVPFFFSGIVLFCQFSIHIGFFFVVSSLFLIIFELIKAYQDITGSESGKLTGQSALIRAWLNPAAHRALVSGVFLVLQLGFHFHIAASLAYGILPVLIVLLDEVGPRVPRAAEALDQAKDFLEKKVNVDRIAAVLEIALAPWLGWLTVYQFSLSHFIALTSYLVLVSLYGATVLQLHQEVYGLVAGSVVSVIPALEGKGRRAIDKLLEFGQALYPGSLPDQANG
jgi:hypothetical protein